MAREIKFRAWNPKQEIMAQPCYTEIYKDGSFCAGKENHWQSTWHNDDKPIIMQYTGLKDKNGVEIYEGDIIENDAARWVIEWFRDGFIAVTVASVYQGYVERNTDNSTYPCLIIGAEVKGNIYQNPEKLA